MNTTEIRAQLMRKRNEILGRVNQLSHDIRGRTEPLAADAEEQAIELENLDVLFQIDAASRLELSMINNALERLDNQTYGICTRCGKTIGELRLYALPYAETCVGCAHAGSTAQ